MESIVSSDTTSLGDPYRVERGFSLLLLFLDSAEESGSESSCETDLFSGVRKTNLAGPVLDSAGWNSCIS
jgi:hypothetical protein